MRRTRLSAASIETYVPVLAWHVRSDSQLHVFTFLWRRHGLLQLCYMRVPLSCLCMFFPWGSSSLKSDWTLSCDQGLDYAS